MPMAREFLFLRKGQQILLNTVPDFSATFATQIRKNITVEGFGICSTGSANSGSGFANFGTAIRGFCILQKHQF